MDESFKKTCRTTTNLLGGQSKIQKITAIQLMQDLVNVHAPRMAVTGTGSDNKAYVGFVDMPLEAECAVPFTTSVRRFTSAKRQQKAQKPFRVFAVG